MEAVSRSLPMSTPFPYITGAPSHRDSFTLLVFFEERGRRGASRARAPFSSLYSASFTEKKAEKVQWFLRSVSDKLVKK